MKYEETQTKIESAIQETRVKVATLTTLSPERQKQLEAVKQLSLDLLKASLALSLYLISWGYTKTKESIEDLNSNPNFKPKENFQLWMEYFQYQINQLKSQQSFPNTSKEVAQEADNEV